MRSRAFPVTIRSAISQAACPSDSGLKWHGERGILAAMLERNPLQSKIMLELGLARIVEWSAQD